jgi:cardiolipin synthase
MTARLPRAHTTPPAFEYALDPNSFLPGHEVTVLVDGTQAFPSMLDALAKAERFAHVETYIFKEDRVGHSFAQAFIAAARRGVTVRVLIDGFGGFGLSQGFIREMTDEGVEVVFFRPVSLKGWRRWHRRDHRKVVVVDGKVGFTGGLNLSDEYAPVEQEGLGWRDTHVRVEGPVVDQLERSFREVWIRSGGKAYPAQPPIALESAAVGDREFAAVAMSDESGQRSAIRRRLLHGIEQARSYVYIANAYFVPDGRILRALVRAARRGARVDLILPAESDVRWVQWAGEYLYGRLLKRGVHIYLWTQRHMHAKTVVVDGVWTTIGSYNLDYVSLFMNLEVVLEVLGEKTGHVMHKIFEIDRARCTALTRREWRQRPWYMRFISWLAYRFRRWL